MRAARFVPVGDEREALADTEEDLLAKVRERTEEAQSRVAELVDDISEDDLQDTIDRLDGRVSGCSTGGRWRSWRATSC